MTRSNGFHGGIALTVSGLPAEVSGSSQTSPASSILTVTGKNCSLKHTAQGVLKTLWQLGIPPSAWPKVKMINLPTNQDACKNTSLSLGYTGTGQGN
jgi:hypothetical protein